MKNTKEAKKEITQIKLADIVEEEDRWNRPLEEEDGPEMEVLVASLAAMGQLSPVVLRPAGGGKWRVVMGHRRVRAARKLKWKSMAAVAEELSDGAVEEVAFAENYARKGVSIFWEAVMVQRWLGEGRGKDEIGKLLGRGKAWVERRAMLSLEACKRFKREFLDPRGISIDEVHPANLEMLGIAGEGVWESLEVFGNRNCKGKDGSMAWRKFLGKRDWLAKYFVRDQLRSFVGMPWAGWIFDPLANRPLPDCQECKATSGALRNLFPEMEDYSFGWNEDNKHCVMADCRRRKQELWQEHAKAMMEEKFPGIQQITAEEYAKGDWTKCKAKHPDARIICFGGGQAGTWEIVRKVKRVTGSAEMRGSAEEKERAKQQKLEMEERKLYRGELKKKTQELREACKTLADKWAAYGDWESKLMSVAVMLLADYACEDYGFEVEPKDAIEMLRDAGNHSYEAADAEAFGKVLDEYRKIALDEDQEAEGGNEE